jgi:plasmid stabilization system protein ParE
MRQITFHEEEEKATGLGLTFLDEIEKSTQRIVTNPMMYQRVGGEVRQATVTRFPYSILYAIEPDEKIRVLAIAHQKRRPGYWLDRIQQEK